MIEALLIQTPGSPAPQRRANTSSPGCAQTHKHHQRIHNQSNYRPFTHAPYNPATLLLSENMQMFSITALQNGAPHADTDGV